ncbi:hypothetical protein K1T73_16770 [Roseovarius sp. SCSIO 43702]|uniref:hypothetical protein n=1 Tax=Roseovarius sp. SCSIO 43702 TaxID=2823043 RepID=UPI001C73D8B1|nr:hypothetical protein [Roseovarius sp. SCSIO 43702]QYX56665.1 hypothetical protein K1T73_16770 [Roseovarius sp. SCSIO 43702]
MPLSRAIWPALAVLPLAACEASGGSSAPVPAQEPPRLGGPPERLELCAARAGVRGDYETETFFDEGRPIVRIVSGGAVSDDQMDKANACLAEGAT